MRGVNAMYTPGEAAVRAVKAGNDIVLHSPDDAAALAAIKAAVEAGEIPQAQVDASVERILRAKASARPAQGEAVSLDALTRHRRHARATSAIADEVSQRSITLVKDERNAGAAAARRATAAGAVPVGARLPERLADRARRAARFIPELKKRWPNVTAIELSDRTTPSELELVRAMAPRVRRGCRGGRSCAPRRRAAAWTSRRGSRGCCRTCRGARERKAPFVTVFFGNPYVARSCQTCRRCW